MKPRDACGAAAILLVGALLSGCAQCDGQLATESIGVADGELVELGFDTGDPDALEDCVSICDEKVGMQVTSCEYVGAADGYRDFLCHGMVAGCR